MFNNGNKPGGYNIESYEPTDISPYEKKITNDFIKSTFERPLMPQPNFGLNITNLNNAFQNYNINNNNISIAPMPQSMVPFINTVNSSSNPFAINKIIKSSNIINVNNVKLVSPIVPKYSNMTKIVYPEKTVFNFINGNNYNIPKMNYPNIIPQTIKRNKTIERVIPSMRPIQLIKKYQFNNNPFAVPLQNPRKVVINNYGSKTKNILPLYPTITYRRRNIY